MKSTPTEHRPRLLALMAPLALLLMAPPALAQPVAAPPAPGPEPAPAVQPEPQVGYDGGYVIRSADGSAAVKINGRVQTQFDFEKPDEGDWEGAFLIRRARLKLSGHAIDDDLDYKFEIDAGRGEFTLLEYWVEWAALPEALQLRVGQWRIPYLREEITSSGKFELVSRALNAGAFGEDFDVGMAIHNGYASKKDGLGWVVGVFNGTGTSPRYEAEFEPVVDDQGELTGVELIDLNQTNVPGRLQPAIAARIGFNRGVTGYDQPDLDRGPLGYSIAAGGVTRLDADDDGESSYKATVDYLVHVAGLSTSGGLQYAVTTFDEVDEDLTLMGARLQAGYMVTDHVQPAVRYARVWNADAETSTTEYTGGVSVYFYGHDLKWQTAGGARVEEFGDESTSTLFAQTQLQFEF